MKKLYFLTLVLVFSFANSQIINFPDANFKAKLLAADYSNNIAKQSNGNSIKIDVNNDGEVQVSEITNVSYLDISGTFAAPSITDLTGITNFSNLIGLNASNNTVVQVNLNNLSFVEDVNLSNNQLITLNIQNTPSLKSLNLDYNNFANLSIQSLSLENLRLLENPLLSNLDIQNCPSLKLFSLSNSQISSLNFTNFISLVNLYLSNNSILSSVILDGCTSLYDLEIRYCAALQTINLNNLNSLYDLDLNVNNILNSVNLSGCTSLYRAQISYNPMLNSILVENLSSLTLANIFNNNLQSITTTNLPSLSQLVLKNNQLSSLNLATCQNLTYLDVQNNSFTQLQLSYLPVLKKVFCSHNSISAISTNNFPSLELLDCSYNYLTSLDLNSNTGLIQLYAYNNNLDQLFIKNGSLESTVSFNNNPIQYICCDTDQISSLLTTLSNYGYSNVVVNSYCSFIPGGTFYTVQGNTRYDLNNNGCDPSDPVKPFQKLNITDGIASGSIIADTSGAYSIAVQAGNHTFTPILENPTYWSISPSSFSVNFPTQNSPFVQDLCIAPNGTHNDLEVVIFPLVSAVPGFDAAYKILYRNNGTTSQSGTLNFNFDDTVSNFYSATVAPSTQNFGLLNWNFSNLAPLDSGEILVILTLNTPTQTPSLIGGDVLDFQSTISAAVDETPNNNTFNLSQVVVNSLDPNDKTCLEGTSISQSKVGDYVHYLIRFENTGSANAQNIVVKDVIDTSKFDLNSLIALNGSHPYVTRITKPNTVEFIFENIQLPFQNTTNDGYVLFKIKTLPTLAPGNTFSNDAEIYFDYNAPIVTNDYLTTVQSNLGIQEVNDKTFKTYPNPVIDFLYFEGIEKVEKIEVFDLSGRIIFSKSINSTKVNLSHLSLGNYLIKIFAKDQQYLEKIIKK